MLHVTCWRDKILAIHFTYTVIVYMFDTNWQRILLILRVYVTYRQWRMLCLTSTPPPTPAVLLYNTPWLWKNKYIISKFLQLWLAPLIQQVPMSLFFLGQSCWEVLFSLIFGQQRGFQAVCWDHDHNSCKIRIVFPDAKAPLLCLYTLRRRNAINANDQNQVGVTASISIHVHPQTALLWFFFSFKAVFAVYVVLFH